MKLATKVLIMMAIVALLMFVVSAQEDTMNDDEINFDDEEEMNYEEEDQTRREGQNLGYIFPSPDVSVSYVLPNNANNKIAVGQKTSILLGFTNNGIGPFTIYGIRGYIYHPQDFNYVLQNFTAIRYNTTVQPEETNSVVYEFASDPRLEPVKFGVNVQVFYINEDNDTFVHSFYNQTVSFTENPDVVDVQQYYLYFTFLAIVLGAGYIAYKYYGGAAAVSSFSNQSSKPSGSETPNTPTSASEKSDDSQNKFSFVNSKHFKALKAQKKRKH